MSKLLNVREVFEHVESCLAEEATAEDIISVIEGDFVECSAVPTWEDLRDECDERYKDNGPKVRILSWEGEIVHQVEKKGMPWPDMDKVVFNGRVIVQYKDHWGEEPQTIALAAPTWKEFIEAIDQVVYLSGDHHHIFWEGGKATIKVGSNEMTYTVQTGS